MLAATADENLRLGIIGPPGETGGRIAEKVDDIAGRVGLDRRNIHRFVSQLSGGNQQKVLFGKAFGRDYDVYVFDEPTVGVDMGTRAQLYRVVKDLAERGKAVALISSDLPEVLSLSHRVLVFSDGQISAELEGEAISESAVLAAFFEKYRETA